MPIQTLAVTGHRPNKLGGYTTQAHMHLVRFAVLVLRELQPNLVITGMAQGWDQAIAHAAAHLHIPFQAAVPCDGQEKMWPVVSQEYYQRLLVKAAQVTVVRPGPYAPEKMQVRNEWMVNHATDLCALWNGTSGGTANCVKYANYKALPVLNKWQDWSRFASQNSSIGQG